MGILLSTKQAGRLPLFLSEHHRCFKIQQLFPPLTPMAKSRPTCNLICPIMFQQLSIPYPLFSMSYPGDGWWKRRQLRRVLYVADTPQHPKNSGSFCAQARSQCPSFSSPSSQTSTYHSQTPAHSLFSVPLPPVPHPFRVSERIPSLVSISNRSKRSSLSLHQQGFMVETSRGPRWMRVMHEPCSDRDSAAF